jgi:hypothetical protein
MSQRQSLSFSSMQALHLPKNVFCALPNLPPTAQLTFLLADGAVENTIYTFEMRVRNFYAVCRPCLSARSNRRKC